MNRKQKTVSFKIVNNSEWEEITEQAGPGIAYVLWTVYLGQYCLRLSPMEFFHLSRTQAKVRELQKIQAESGGRTGNPQTRKQHERERKPEAVRVSA